MQLPVTTHQIFQQMIQIKGLDFPTRVLQFKIY